MNRAFSKIWIIIVLIILIAGGIFAWQYWWSPKEEVKDGTANWKTYKNEEYGFEIKYPTSNISVEELSEGILFSLVGEKCEEPHCPSFMFIHPIWLSPALRKNPPSSLEEIIKVNFSLKEFEEFKIPPEESDCDCIEKTIIGKNIQGYKLHNWTQATGICHYFGEEGDRSIEIERSAIGLTCSFCEDDSLFNQILSTFKFLD